jgi:NADPH:quinone reductase-like Zn-dependent oxidoreductase
MTMQGTRLVFRETGKPSEKLELEEFAPRDPEAGEVRVRMIAAPLNPADLNTIESREPGWWRRVLPRILWKEIR